ncbi:hypothetical protein [Bacillus cereus group sp. BfR-BA-01352]|nr:hypothetical protein [Bacillus cereus group sp. BfR-BA-01352]
MFIKGWLSNNINIQITLTGVIIENHFFFAYDFFNLITCVATGISTTQL